MFYIHVRYKLYCYIYAYIYTHTLEFYSAIKKNENLKFSTTCMDLEGIIFTEISVTEKAKYSMSSLICEI